MVTSTIDKALYRMLVSVPPKKFKEIMQKVLREHDALLCKYWYSEQSDYTDNVWGAKHGRTGKIYKAIGNEFGLKFLPEYWEVDAVYYREECPLAKSKRGRAKFLSIALEHENNPDTSYDEICRLLNCTALLKVLVTYPDNIKHGRDLLRGYARQIKAVDRAILNFSNKQKIIVVFGHHHNEEDPLKWYYHLYNPTEEKFVLMP